jgi:hemerythrin-like metal-binding protein
MAIFKWDNEYSVNIFVIDNHHKKLFDIMNSLYALMAEGADDDSIIKIINELLDYTNYHFSEEEKMMEQVGYPELNQHRQLHRDFIAKLEEAKTKANNGMAIFMATKVADLGVDWLKEHILTVDSRYKKYIDEKGISV